MIGGVVGVVGVLLVGFALGVVVARALARRAAGDAVPQPTVAAESPPVDVSAAIREAAQDLDAAIVICDRDGTVVYRNLAADAMATTHVGIIVGEHVDRALARALDAGRSQTRVDLHGPPRVSLEVVARRLNSGAAIAMVDDVSERTRIDAMRTDFVANISHELKTPVGAIAVLADALDGEQDPAVIARMSGRIVTEAHRAVTTIDDLLELSRIESSRLDDEVVDLNDVVDAAVVRGREVDVDGSVQVRAIDPGRAVLVRGDRRQLVSAIGNLVENAVKYSDDGGVVTVRVGVDTEHVAIEVADAGAGIPRRDLGRIFERFYRVDRARSRSTGGTGLGLSIVRHVATNHGGDVDVTSEEGEGSTFVLRLPVSALAATSTGEDAT